MPDRSNAVDEENAHAPQTTKDYVSELAAANCKLEVAREALESIRLHCNDSIIRKAADTALKQMDE